MPYAIDLFCGAGGMSEGILQAGYHILFSSDINVDCERTYVNRHNQLGLIQGENTFFHREDIRNLTGEFILDCIHNLNMFRDGQIPIPERIDTIFGGPPCQGFSRAGKRDRNDPRNMLFREYLRVINEIGPRYVVMENVEGFTDTRLDNFIGNTGLRYPDDTLVSEILISEFNQIGYNTLQPQILDASDFGVPQKRKRVIFIAYREGEQTPEYPIPTHIRENKITLLEAIGDLISDRNLRNIVNPHLTEYQIESQNGRTPTINGVIPNNNDQLLNYDMARHQQIITERFSLYNEGEDSSALRRRIMREGIDLENKPHLVKECIRQLDGNMDEAELIRLFQNPQVNEEAVTALITKKSARTKLHRNEPSLTVLTLPDDYISPFENRIFTVRELARLQSFDDSFEFLGKRTTGGQRRRVEVPQYTQVGNAVPPLLAKAIARKIIEALRGE